ncbi:hypothetical protein BP5796_01227 [Coleophoma crateriformis]|uniref:Uncharacterized protein n=1 Tax=Coleophoma crateriformis TaxID=565419 RepID=A0A3D8SZT6_9HELO|nr:hypothetical protein BP5796_01227 [Coleophoma crateriformis]
MTTIHEMDEFFDFDHAANQNPDPSAQITPNRPQLPSGPYNIDLAFAEEDTDEDSFTAIQHFSATQPDQLALHLQEIQNGITDTSMMHPDEIADFPRWIDGLYFPTQPCAYCRSMRIHCKIIKEGYRKGSCTSCVALTRACSLTYDATGEKGGPEDEHTVLSRLGPSVNSSSRSSGDFSMHHDDLLASNDKGPVGVLNLRPCEYCHNRDYECKVIQEGEQKGSCTSCYALEHACSLITQEDSYELSIDDPLHPNHVNAWLTTKTPHEESTLFEHEKTIDWLPDNVAPNKSPTEDVPETSEIGPKVGARFSRESVRVLRGWLSTHHRHPYPSDEQKECLQRQTGLNKTQITNWLANARRRGKVRPPRSTSPMPQSNYARGMDIPRRSTPALENMNPMERWKHSPPEHEPASITAISKAVTSSTLSSGRESPYSYGFSDDGSARSIANVSSTSSLGTSHSSTNSFASAFSHKSRGSFGSFNSFGNRGRRRRRRQAPKAPNAAARIGAPARTFQCTFCTETFKTKHDWQRHEKSLHLSLERWVCSPTGHTAMRPETNQLACVYCGLANPSANHAEVHNHTSCTERSLEERTFYRKDHLRQHLNLVHDVKFQAWSMDSWRVATPEIRSRCGFCGIVMDSWSIRVDHLAEHFKGGKSMADWQGDWGFEPQVLDVIENGMPPYLIHDERNSPHPFEASAERAEIHQRSAYDIVKIGLVDFINGKVVHSSTPTDAELLVEAQKILNLLTATAEGGSQIASSWFNDLIVFSGSPAQKELSKNKEAESIQAIHCNIKDNSIMTRPCPREIDLMHYVENRMAIGITPIDSELQIEACRILEESEKTSDFRCKPAVDWFKYLIRSSTSWLAEFRRRANLPRSSDMEYEHIRSTDATSIDYSLHTFGRIEGELADYVRLQQSLGFTPTDMEIQDKARWIIYKSDDPWNQTAIDNPAYLQVFKEKHGLAPRSELDLEVINEMLLKGNMNPINLEQPASTANELQSPKNLHWDLKQTAGSPKAANQPLDTSVQNQLSTDTNPTQPLRYFLTDANCYRRLVRELSRFVTSCMSANNPNQHVPSDAELQNQARWIVYDDDDPWNQTAADNAEWLIRFKRDVNLAPQEEGPGLPETSVIAWNLKDNGSGFSPPYAMPKEPPAPYTEDQNLEIRVDGKSIEVKPSTANKFLHSMMTRYPPPARVFCSRDLEKGLNSYMRTEMAKGHVPTDDNIRAHARKILSSDKTAADDPQLLQKFKAMHGITTPGSTGEGQMPDFSSCDSILAGHITPEEDRALLQQFDAELAAGTMDMSNFDMDMNIPMDLGDFEMDFGTTDTLPNPIEEPLEMETADLDYASLHRVHSATASPLRRRASHFTANKAGFVAPGNGGGFLPRGISPAGSFQLGHRPGGRSSHSPTNAAAMDFPFPLTDLDASTF